MSHLGTHRTTQQFEDDIKFPKSISLSPREAIVKAQEINKEAGHENNGYLSFSHGFAPRIAPITHFPPEYDAWNKLCDKLPYLLSSKKLRSYCDSLPVLDANQLPPIFALRAANVLGYTAHVYWHLGDPPEERKIPEGLEVPWKIINEFYLGRKGVPPYLGFMELLGGNFRFEEGKVPPPPEGTDPCAWITKELVQYGSVEYYPTEANIANFHPNFWVTGLPEERIFFGVVTELHTVGAPAVQLVVDSQEAVSTKDIKKLKESLDALLDLLNKLTFDVFSKIQQQRKAPFYTDAAIWSKVVAPFATPMHSTAFGPSGTASPIIHLLDAFFGRIKHEHFIGKEVRGIYASFPPNWKDFFNAVRNGPSVQTFVVESDDRELQGLFGTCLRQYAGENGFLGRHKLKTVGYLEISMKLGRAFTLGGNSGLLKDRGWDKISDELEVGQEERFAIPLKASGLCHVGKIIQVPKESLGSTNKASFQVVIDTTGSGIRHTSGAHVGVIYESRAKEVHKCLLAFANGDRKEAVRLGEEYMVDLNDKWIRSLQKRQEYHDTTTPDDPKLPRKLKLSTFLQWGQLRPASRRMLMLAYASSNSSELIAILNEELEAALTFSDVITILKRGENPVDLLKEQSRRGSEIDFAKIEARLGLIKRRRDLTRGASSSILNGTGLSTVEQERVQVRSKSISILREKVKSVVLKIPKLCDLIEPIVARQYSIASSPLVHPNELHVYVQHLRYSTKSAVATASPLLADTQAPVHQRGAASDYIVSKSLPRYYLAIDAIAEMAGLKPTDDYKRMGHNMMFHLNDERKEMLKKIAHLDDEEIDSIVSRAKGYKGGGENMFKNLTEAIEEEIRDKPDPRDMTIVLEVATSPRFHLPKQRQPCIMIAGGSGIAPFRSFWQALAVAGRTDSGSKHLLIIQQRTRSSMEFEDEILTMVKAGIMDVEIMFSQDECVATFDDNEIVYEDFPGRKGYIDKIIQSEAIQERLAHLIRKDGAHLYVCGQGQLAKTAVDALDNCLCNIFGEADGKDELERMVAENRMVLDIFTSLEDPKTKSDMQLSELCQCNDFAGVLKRNKGKENPLLLVINETVYDMKKLFRLHPGGDQMLKLYCGMDATTAWEAVKHDKSPEVVAMLEMFNTERTIFNPEIANLDEKDRNWYKLGWKATVMTLVEIQNALSLAFEKNWDTGAFSAAEKHLGEHFTVWKGKAVWRPKRSLLKGQFFVETHDRLWSMFLPLLFGDSFDEILAGMATDDRDFPEEIDMKFERLGEEKMHKMCDAVCPLLTQELGKASAIENNQIVPPGLQSYMEEVRKADDALLESIKARLITGLQVFETQKSPLLPAFYARFDSCIMGIIREDLTGFISKIASLTTIAFGSEQVNKVANMPNLKRGGVTLIDSPSLGYVERHYIDKDKATTTALGHVAYVHEVKSANGKQKCPFS